MAFCLGNPFKVDIPYKNDKGVKIFFEKNRKKIMIFIFYFWPSDMMVHSFLVIFMKNILYIFTPLTFFGVKLVISFINLTF